MNFRSLLWILLFISVQEVSLEEEDYNDEYEDPQPLNCSTTESIKGGHVTYSQGGLEGSVLTYHCGLGKYPYPVSYRLCGANGEWSFMRLANGKPVTRATCKDVLCPAQLQLDHGDFWPKDQWFGAGMTQSFSCMEGFTLYGSTLRNCTFSGEWTGTTPICDNHAGDCNDPGIPPGAQRLSSWFHIGEKIVYLCQTGLDLLGSTERVCLENREWSGSTPRCQGPNTFDPPGVVAKAMAGSLAGVMDIVSSDSKKKTATSFGRTIHVTDGSRINVYILMDTSGSIRQQDFEMYRNATIALIRKLDSYEVQLKFHVLSFATEAKDIVDITQTDISSSVEDVIWNLMDFDYQSHGHKTGTNLHSALHRVSEKISLFKQQSSKSHFNETQNIIIIETDGYSNIGKKPQDALSQIRQLLGYSITAKDHTDETLLDVYVFGVGDQLNKNELNSLASKKQGEQHVFILKDFQALGEVFNSIISDKSVTMCGVMQEHVSKEQESDGIPVYTQPWHVSLRAPEWGPKKSCFGSIMSQNWVLTAAHCFARASTDKVSYQVDIEHGDGRVKSSMVIIHPKYNISALKHRNVSEFYDYDVALVYVKKSIPLSWKARPICLPCTIPASRALKSINSTCQQHRKELLPHEITAGFFIHKSMGRKQTHIHTKSRRPGCIEKAGNTLKDPTDVTLKEYVTDRFLCSGGTSGYQDAITCKGDSGGSLFLQRRKRYFQVGVVSWGISDVCDPHNSAQGQYSSDRPPPNARDFHIDLFEIMPWLKQHLGEQIQFLPEID